MALMKKLNGYEICDTTARTAALNGITTAGTGAAYTAIVSGITTLVAGAHFTMIPHTVSTSTTPTLNVNGLGAKTIRQRLSNSTTSTVALSSTNMLAQNKPVNIVYDGTYWVVEFTRPNVAAAYGTLPIANGGTGATTAAGALANLGTAKITIGTADAPATGEAGSIYIKLLDSGSGDSGGGGDNIEIPDEDTPL